MFPRLTFLLLLFALTAVRGDSLTDDGKNAGIFALINEKLEMRLGDYVNDFTAFLADYNDRHLGASEFGRMIQYDKIKPSLETETGRSQSPKSIKKMSSSMMPLVFHVGATSTWMLITSIMAAKSVAIGLALLVFKIAVSSAKLASFFTLLKGKHQDDHHHSWNPPHHYELHGQRRSFDDIEHHSDHQTSLAHQSAWNSYAPEWTPDTEYNTIPNSYKHISGEVDAAYQHTEERKKVDKKIK